MSELPVQSYLSLVTEREVPVLLEVSLGGLHIRLTAFFVEIPHS